MSETVSKNVQDWFTDGDKLGTDTAALAPRRRHDEVAAGLALVEEFRKRPAPGCWGKLQRAKVADGLAQRLEWPVGFDQAQSNLCGVFAFLHAWCADAPREFAQLGIDLFEKGEGVLRGHDRVGGKLIQPSDATRNCAPPTHKDGTPMQQGDWLVGAAIRDAFNSFFDYSSNGPEALKAINMPADVEGEFKAAGYRRTLNRTSPIDPAGWNNLLEATMLFERGWRVVLLVHSNLFSDEWRGKPSSVKNHSNHWVGLESRVVLSVFGDRRMIMPFNVWTWGGVKQVPPDGRPLPFETVGTNYFGFVAGLP